MNKLSTILQGISISLLMSCSSLAFADISGLVFRDFNASGTFDTGSNFNEVAQAGVTVKAFDATGAQTASATSAADGSYTLTGLTSGADYRVEFSWSETWLKSGKSGGTSVQFAKDGATNLNFALSSPEDFSQDNPQLVTTNFAVGESSDPKVAGQSRLIEFGYLSGANGRRFAASDDEAVTLQPEITDIAISSAPSSAGTANAVSPNVTGHSRTDTVKMGEVGPLYGLAYHRDTNILLAGAFMKRFVGFPNGASDTKLGTIYAIDRKVSPNTVTPFFTANAGVDSHDYSNAALNAPGGDTTAASQVGKAGWADIDLSPDGSMLYAVNLFDKKIYAIPVTKGVSGLSAGAASTITFPASATTDVCANGDWAAGGLKVTQDSVLATVTCTAETSQSASDLHFYVYKISRDNPSTFTKIVDRGNYPRDIDWHPWVSDPYNYDHGGYNQPWAMDVEFDDLGRLYVGVRNRSADMESANDGNFFFEFGDTIVGLPNGDGTYDTTYTDEFVDDNSGHMENDMGALAHWSGSGTIVTPAHIGNLIQGIRTYSTTTPITSTANGTVSPLRYFGIHQTPRDVTALGDPFGKVAGLGDLEVLTQPAPIEVGNRVWLDTDKDGIQDAGEAGIANVQVQLTCATDNATATTGSDGSYYFSNASAGNATFMSAGESCTLSIATGQTALNGYSITTQNADSVTDNNATTDIRDSDADSNSSISFTVGNAGDSNHGLDFGYQVASIADWGDAPDSYKTTNASNGANHIVVAGLNLGATVDMEVDGQPSINADGDGSDEDGVQFLTPLLPGGDAIIAVASTQPKNSSAKLDAWIDFNGDGDFADAGEQIATNSNIKGLALYNQGSLVLDVTVPTDAKVGTTYARFRLSTAGGLAPNGLAADGEVEDYAVTIQQGAIVGDFVWQDSNKDGVQSNGEPAIAGVLVKLVRVSDGVMVNSAFTDTLGKYAFQHVLPGDYQVEFVAPTGYSFTTATQGADINQDSNADSSTGRTTTFTVINGDDQRQWDAGLVLANANMVYCDAKPFSATELKTGLSLPKFDPALGTLQTVKVTANAATRQFMAVENFAVQAQMIKMGSSVDGSLTLPNASTLDTQFSYSSGYKSLTAADGILDYKGSSAFTFSEWQYAVNSNSVNYTPLMDFIAATSGDVLVLPYETLSGLSMTGGGGNNMFFQRTKAAVGVCVTYVYLPQTDLKLVKTVDKTQVKSGETVIYTLTISNESTLDATGVQVTDQLPARLLYMSDDSAGAYNATSGIWDAGTVTKGTSKTVKITVKVQ